MTPRLGLEELLAQVVARINAPRQPGTLLPSLVSIAHDLIPQPVEVSVVRLDGDRPRSLAGSSRLVLEVDRLLGLLGEGPWFDAAVGPTVDWSTLGDRPEPEARRAARLGLRAQHVVPLHPDRGTVAWLNVYSCGTATITPQTRTVAALFASYAALALAGHTEPEPVDPAIARATGILMERLQVDEERAEVLLNQAAGAGDLDLVEVAHEVEHSAHPAPHSGAVPTERT